MSKRPAIEKFEINVMTKSKDADGPRKMEALFDAVEEVGRMLGKVPGMTPIEAQRQSEKWLDGIEKGLGEDSLSKISGHPAFIVLLCSMLQTSLTAFASEGVG